MDQTTLCCEIVHTDTDIDRQTHTHTHQFNLLMPKLSSLTQQRSLQESRQKSYTERALVRKLQLYIIPTYSYCIPSPLQDILAAQTLMKTVLNGPGRLSLSGQDTTVTGVL